MPKYDVVITLVIDSPEPRLIVRSELEMMLDKNSDHIIDIRDRHINVTRRANVSR